MTSWLKWWCVCVLVVCMWERVDVCACMVELNCVRMCVRACRHMAQWYISNGRMSLDPAFSFALRFWMCVSEPGIMLLCLHRSTYSLLSTLQLRCVHSSISPRKWQWFSSTHRTHETMWVNSCLHIVGRNYLILSSRLLGGTCGQIIKILGLPFHKFAMLMSLLVLSNEWFWLSNEDG